MQGKQENAPERRVWWTQLGRMSIRECDYHRRDLAPSERARRRRRRGEDKYMTPMPPSHSQITESQVFISHRFNNCKYVCVCVCTCTGLFKG